jgi:hypothetical protein
MNAVKGHACTGRGLWVPVQSALVLVGQLARQCRVHLAGPSAHEPAQGLRQGLAGMHGRHGTVHQKLGREALGNQFGQAVLPLCPLQGSAQAGGIVSAHGQHDHVVACGR